MSRRVSLRRGVLAGIVVLVTTATGCGGDDRSVTAFCESVESLRSDNPFASRPVSTPEQMQTAFAGLHRGARQIAGSAPAEVRGQAERYLLTVEGLIEVLSPVGYRPLDVDRLAYDEATSRHAAATDSLENAADAVCDT